MIWPAFFSGMTMATFAASGLFFIKFWRASGDRFFLHFSIACWLISIERIVAVFNQETLAPIRTSLESAATWVYVIRLLAFLLIFIAVMTKNRANKAKK